MSSPRRLLAAVGLILAASIALPARAQVARGGGAASAEVMQELQQLASERTSLQAENARMKQELDGLRKERDSLKGAQQAAEVRARGSSAELAQSTAQREALTQELQRTRQSAEELIGKFRETIQTLREIETDRAKIQQSLATSDRELKTCIDRNLALYKLNDEVLTHFDHESLWSRLGTAEPFTRIKRVQLENLIDDYRSRAQDQRATPENLKIAAGRPPPPAAAGPASPTGKPRPPPSTPPPPPQPHPP